MGQVIKIIGIIFIFYSYQAFAGKISNPVLRSDSTKKKFVQQLQVQTFEDNLFGYTADSDDEPFIDVTLSVQARIYPFDYLMNMLPHPQNLHLNVAFSGRFGQYKGTRYSSPVIEKRLNPVLFLQYSPMNKFKNLALRLSYGHESNGQALDDSVSFFKTAALLHNTVNQTKDKVSRGWDYAGLSFISDFFPEKNPNVVFEMDVSLKYYLSYGVFQGNKEEYYPWERSWSGANYTRNDVSGISLSFTCLIDSFFINKIRVNFETGITHSFFNNSIKLLLGFKLGKLPLALTYRYGYNGDLAQYGKLNSSVGVAYILSSFNRPGDKRKGQPLIQN